LLPQQPALKNLFTDTGLIFFAARLLLQGGGVAGGSKGAAELLSVLQQQRQQQVGKDSALTCFPSLCVMALDLSSIMG
jgi:hypothetical protein